MKILSMSATFGKLDNQKLELAQGLNVIHAPNEWGKSTWSAFIVAMLYGINTREITKTDHLADKERYAPWSGAPMSGSMDIEWRGRRITIQRSNKGRTVFGEFRAFETESGLPVEKLTGANCGEMLLGVEKNVFVRSGFLRLADLPVTQDEALRRRLNALVTTGDESNTSDILGQKLRELKNACRVNRANGLIPKAELQARELEDKLEQMAQLRQQIAHHSARQAEEAARQEALDNHIRALDYENNLRYAQNLAAAEASARESRLQMEEWEDRCAGLPGEEQLQGDLNRICQLRADREELQLKLQLLPEAPKMPEAPEAFREMNGQEAVAHAQLYQKVYEDVDKERRSWLLGALGIGLVLAGVLLGIFLALPWLALMIPGGTLVGIWENRRRRAARTQRDLQDKFSPFAPGQWIAEAKRWEQTLEAADQAQQEYGKRRQELEQQAMQLQERQDLFTKGKTLAEAEMFCKDAIEKRQRLVQARRELERCDHLVQTLRDTHKEVAPPKYPDQLTYTRQQTQTMLADCALSRKDHQQKLDQLQGRMEALGQEEPLRRQLAQVQQRLSRLNKVNAALELAIHTLGVATTELQRRFAPRIAQRAQELFGRLTGSRYDRLSLTQDLSVLAGAEGESTLHAALWRSDGTVDQLYLALRLAVAEELTPEAPLVLDDALVRFDDTRLAYAMEILKEYSRTKQVILFTCHRREEELV